jgi:hypothetical protein
LGRELKVDGGAQMLSFKTVKSPNGKYNEIQIACDRKGMAILIGTLAELVGEAASHRHLRSPAAGGTELDPTTPWGEEADVCEVIITYDEAGSN